MWPTTDVALLAKKTGRTRALCALEKSRAILDRSIVLIGNAPLALAGLARMILNGEVRPRLVIAMPVGFVNVLESKQTDSWRPRFRTLSFKEDAEAVPWQ